MGWREWVSLSKEKEWSWSWNSWATKKEKKGCDMKEIETTSGGEKKKS